MDLWSKGLGRLVLKLRLSERNEMRRDDDSIAISGSMGKPTYWNFAVRLREDDVLDFLLFLRQPEVVKYIVASDQRWEILKAAVGGIVFFTFGFVRNLLGLAPAPAPALPEASGTNSKQSGETR